MPILVRTIFRHPLPFLRNLGPVARNLSVFEEHCPSERFRRKDPFKMKLDSPEFRSIFTPELENLDSLFKKYNFELRIAGGAVRDLLMGKIPDDIDFATTATPSQMQEMFTKEQIRMLNKRGEKHGTITCRINDKANFEVTTLRIDVVCDGRRAEVQYTTDWYLDAMRRDLTINSLFLDLDGTVIDYFNGIQDVKDRQVIFVQDPVQRIQEDYLRILRYFRFFGRVSRSPTDHRPETLTAIRDNAHGLQQVSGERIWIELKKIATGRFVGPVLKTMLAECQVGPFIGLPENPDLEEMDRVVSRLEKHNLSVSNAMTVISSLLRTENEVLAFDKRLKVSRNERLQGLFISKNRGSECLSPKLFQDLFLDEGGDKIPEARERVCELSKYLGLPEVVEHMQTWEAPPFPVTGFHIVAAGVRKGPAMKRALDLLYQLWKESHYKATKEELVHKLDKEQEFAGSKSPKQSKIDI